MFTTHKVKHNRPDSDPEPEPEPGHDRTAQHSCLLSSCHVAANKRRGEDEALSLTELSHHIVL